MRPRSKHEYLGTIHQRYKKADRKGKNALLDEFYQNCGHHRKHAIRLLSQIRRHPKATPCKRGKPPIPGLMEVLEVTFSPNSNRQKMKNIYQQSAP